jgi:hypothetical protein
MERNRWETAIRCLEVAVHPNTREDEIIAAVNGFRRTVDGLPVSRVCIEFACGGATPAELAEMQAALERLDRENRELRRRLAVEQTAQAAAAGRLDNAYRRICELTEEAAAAQRLVEAVEREFADFRDAYAQVLKSVRLPNYDARWAPDAASAATDRPPLPQRPFSALLTEARLAADQAASVAGAGNGSGRRPSAANANRPWTA